MRLAEIIGALSLAADVSSGLIDTWVTFGLEMLAIGVGLLVASRWLAEARPLVWTVIGIELSRGIAADLYMLLRGLDPAVPLVWMVIHSVVIASAIWCLRESAPARRPVFSAAG